MKPARCTMRRRSAAADHIDVVSLRLILGEHPSRDIFRIAAEKIHLDERILFFETFFERPYDLIDDQPGVKSNFTFLSWRLRREFSGGRRISSRRLFDGRAPRMRERNRA